jgi:exopolyphosphatase/guanosine-5'-triphosphate,3'-diphosphate pyrophosphatase
MSVLAAVDIGANSVRLKIARPHGSRLKVIHEDREVTRLGASVFRTGALSPESMAHTLKVLRRFHRSARKFDTEQVRVVATSALRDARNSEAFIQWVRSAIGWQVEVISGLEEGRLIHLGVISNTRALPSRVLLADLGGGSCELTLSVGGHIREIHSLPLGAVRLTAEFLQHDPPRLRELERLRGYIAEELRHVVGKFSAATVRTAIATSGTAAALNDFARSKHPRGKISKTLLVDIAEDLAQLSSAQRAQLPGIGVRRAEIVVAGAFVYAEMMERCGLAEFRYSPLGLRDGLLAQMAAERGSALRTRIETQRWDALQAMARRYSVDIDFAEHVRYLARTLFDLLRSVHTMPATFADWLSAAAMLHETGEYVSRAGRHRHAYYLIANSEILGYTPRERLLIASVARYMGKSRPEPSDRVLKRLPNTAREHVPEAVVLLRLARALNQGRQKAVRTIRVRTGSSQVKLLLRGHRIPPTLELWALAKERSYFREVFGRDLVAGLD